MSEKSRNQMHEDALAIVYCALTYENLQLEYDLTVISADILATPYEEIDLFTRLVTLKAIKNQAAYRELISPHLRRWRYERLPRLTQTIMLLALAHFYEVEKVDKKVVIDTAVRLAKRYLDDGDYKFVNAVLDQALKDD